MLVGHRLGGGRRVKSGKPTHAWYIPMDNRNFYTINWVSSDCLLFFHKEYCVTFITVSIEYIPSSVIQ